MTCTVGCTQCPTRTARPPGDPWRVPAACLR
jgi:hypothetical protein